MVRDTILVNELLISEKISYIAILGKEKPQSNMKKKVVENVYHDQHKVDSIKMVKTYGKVLGQYFFKKHVFPQKY